MIGKIDPANEGGSEATLTDGGVWQSDTPALANYLNLAFNPRDEGPSAGVFGRGAVVAAAQKLGVARWLAPLPEVEPDEHEVGIVY
jgi:hypothetical protein